MENLTWLPGERWKTYNAVYLISNKGRWYSLATKSYLKQKPNNKGYLRAELMIDGKRKQTFTHIAVVKIHGDRFGRSIPEGMDSLIKNGLSIDHVNRIKANCSQKNLELVTHKENCRRKFL